MVVLKGDNVLVSVVLLATLISLCVGIYNGLEDNYGIIPGDVKGGGDVMDRLDSLTLINGIDDIIEALNTIATPTGTQFDVLGALLSAAVGFLKVLTGTILIPIEILEVIVEFYAGSIPDAVSIMIKLAYSIMIGFLVVKAAKGE